MDKQQFLMSSLAKFLQKHVKDLDATVQNNPVPEISWKSDKTPVTKLDEILSSEIEVLMRAYDPDAKYYSEENLSEWDFPLIAVDPLDGTLEYINGNNEWAISIGCFQSKKFEGEGWVYNPKTGEIFSETTVKTFFEKTSYRGEVSRSEWNKGLFEGKSTSTYYVEPMGSIAYKLGRLSQQKCDFVVSLRAKNIWDIAGGTLLCLKAGYKLYSQGREVTTVEKSYEPPLIWCRPSLFDELSKIYL